MVNDWNSNKIEALAAIAETNYDKFRSFRVEGQYIHAYTQAVKRLRYSTQMLMKH